MQFGMHIHWLLSVEQTHINPFTCNPAKLPCRQALHLKCTISYPCLVSMQHFWDIKPGGNTRRMAAATPYILPPCCLFSVLSLSLARSSLLFIFPLPISCLTCPEMSWRVWAVAEAKRTLLLHSRLSAGFIRCTLCRSINTFPEIPGQGWGSGWDKLRYFI